MSDVLTHVDLLTGAFLRQRLESDLIQFTQLARRRGLPLSVLYFDVDNMQEANDLHGREAVDAALGTMAETISRVLNGMGPIGRVGDDEFAVVLLNVPLVRARRLAERVRQALSRNQYHSLEGAFQLTVSVGVAGMKDSEPPGNLLEAAETACLRVKQGGRDGVACR